MSDLDDCRVVVVDDVKDVRDMLCLMLRMRPGFAVVGEAANGREAIDVARETQPDVVFLDLAMPVMDGLEALPEIRRVAPASKVLVSSGYDDAIVRRAVELGAHGSIVKGGGVNEIAEAILQVWHSRASHTQA